MPYRHQVRFMRDITSDGTTDPVYETALDNWPCDIIPVTGGEKYRGKQIEAETTQIIETRYSPEIDPQMIAVNEVSETRYTINRILEQHGRQRVLLIQVIDTGFTGPAEPIPPTFTEQPEDVTVEEPMAATFNAAASGDPTPTYQWQKFDGVDWNNIPGATRSEYVIFITNQSMTGDQFRCVATNVAGSAISDPATLTVTAPVPTGIGTMAVASTFVVG